MPIDYQKEPWRESLLNFCSSPSICCQGLCPCCLFGKNAARISNVSCFAYCCGYSLLMSFLGCGLIHMPIRSKMREKYGLREEPSDLVAACFLSPLAVCQEAREILSREKSPGNNQVRTSEPKRTSSSTAESEVSSVAESTGN